MQNRSGRTPVQNTQPTQADEALRRAQSAGSDARRMLARRAGLMFLRGLNDMTRQLPSPAGTVLRVTVTVIDGGEDLGSVDVDSTNLDDLGRLASRRAVTFHRKPALAAVPAPSGKPVLRVVGGGK